MGWKENKLTYVREYNKNKYEQLNLQIPKGMKEKIKVAAEFEGKSMTVYVVEAIEEKMEKE